MEVAFNQRTGLPDFTLSKEDVEDARAVKKMMESRGWKVIAKYYEVARESIIDAGKDGIRTRAKKDLSPEKWAVLKGYDENFRLAERIVTRMEHFLKSQEQAEEDSKNDPNDENQ